MHIDLARRRLTAALAAVPMGKNLNDLISMPGGRGETVVLLHALNDAVAYLGDEYFDPEGLASSATCHGYSEYPLFQYARRSSCEGNTGRFHG